uniref:Uncharacterized protein n=1 Tax=viral metagenome TaxID=1070528 RepID=A0A6C0ESE4_9ZZZZ
MSSTVNSSSFEPLHYGNDWGIFIDIEKMEYNINYFRQNRLNNKKMDDIKKEELHYIESLETAALFNYYNTKYRILQITSTTLITAVFTYVVYFIL